jgi:NAD-dependent deacetylase
LKGKGLNKTNIDSHLQQIASWLQNARRVSILTGAGVSKESGIPTFREAQTGLWAKYDPERLATPGGFKSDPKLVWQWYDHRRQLLSSIKPNPGHIAVAELEKLAQNVSVITQNVDGLHMLAGSSNVIELHGSLQSFICFDNHHSIDNIAIGLKEPPTCNECGSLVRPNVVWFGEMLPEGIFEKAHKLVCNCDLLFVIGTSGMVQPSASLPLTAKLQGVKVIEINPEATPITDIANIFLQGQSGQLMPRIVDAYKKQRENSV